VQVVYDFQLTDESGNTHMCAAPDLRTALSIHDQLYGTQVTAAERAEPAEALS
jgi:hypothetical protein